MKKALFLAAMAAVSITSFAFCNVDKIRASGKVITQQRDVSDFSSIYVSDGIKVFVSQTDAPVGELTLKSDDNLVKYVETYVAEGNLHVELIPGTIIWGRRTIEIHVAVPNLRHLECSDGSSLNLRDFLLDNLTVDVKDGGEFSGHFSVDNMNLRLSDGSAADITGDCRSLTITADDGSRMENYDFIVAEADVDISDGSSVYLTVTGTLSVRADDDSRFRYKGNPLLRHVSSSDGSSIEHIY